VGIGIASTLANISEKFLHSANEKIYGFPILFIALRTESMKKWIFIALPLLILAAIIFFFQFQGGAEVESQPEKGDGKIDWIWNDVSRGIQTAREENKPVLLEFWADWCHWCKKMDREVLSDREVVGFVEDNFVPVRIDSDLEENIALLRLYGISGHPAYVVLNQEGEFISKEVGYRPKDAFMDFLAPHAEG